MNNVANNIFSAIDIIVDKKIQEANFDRTIVASIVKSTSTTDITQYQVRYQDSLINAQVTNGAQYLPGDAVYVLLPQNQLGVQNQILGLAYPKNILKPKAQLISEQYDLLPDEIVTDQAAETSVASNVRLTLWKADSDDNIISIDAEKFTACSEQGDTLIISAEFKTTIPDAAQSRGNYGIEVRAASEDGATEVYRLDTSHMTGNYFNFSVFTKQIEAYALKGKKLFLNEILFISEGFVNNSELIISLKNINVHIAKKKIVDNENEVKLQVLTPSGTAFYTGTDSISNGLLMTAELKKGDRVILDSVEYYWFIENPEVVAGDARFLSYGGEGWQLLNLTNNGIIDYFNASYSVTVSQLLSQDRRFKVVAVYGGQGYSETILFQNHTSNQISLNAIQDGDDLKCIPSVSEVAYTYQWYELDSQGTSIRIQGADSENFILPKDQYDQYVETTYRCAVFLEDIFLGFAQKEIKNLAPVIIGVTIAYTISNSSTNPPEGDDILWHDIMPMVQPKMFIWQRTASSYSNGTIEYSYACLTALSSFTIDLTKDSIIINEDSLADLATLSEIKVTALYGNEDVTTESSYRWNAEGCTLGAAESSTVYLTSLDSETAQVTVIASFNIDNYNISTQKTVTITLAKRGKPGDSTISITQYYLSANEKFPVAPSKINTSGWGDYAAPTENKPYSFKCAGTETTSYNIDGSIEKVVYSFGEVELYNIYGESKEYAQQYNVYLKLTQGGTKDVMDYNGEDLYIKASVLSVVDDKGEKIFFASDVKHSVEMAGWTIDKNALKIGDIGNAGSMYLSPTGISSTKSIGNSNGENQWVIAVGNKFGVTNDGSLYGSNVNLSGHIDAAEGSISDFTINDYGIQHGIDSEGNAKLHFGPIFGFGTPISGIAAGDKYEQEWALKVNENFGVTSGGILATAAMYVGPTNGDGKNTIEIDSNYYYPLYAFAFKPKYYMVAVKSSTRDVLTNPTLVIIPIDPNGATATWYEKYKCGERIKDTTIKVGTVLDNTAIKMVCVKLLDEFDTAKTVFKLNVNDYITIEDDGYGAWYYQGYGIFYPDIWDTSIFNPIEVTATGTVQVYNTDYISVTYA